MPVSSDQAGALLRFHGLRSTPQRRAIITAFTSDSDEHLSAEEIHSRASSDLPDLSRGTVYATLSEFVGAGLLATVGTPEPVRYETNLTAHPHFHCRLCQRLFDLDPHRFGEAPPRIRGYRVESVETRMDGVCAECQSYEAGLRQGVREITRQGPPAPLSDVSEVAAGRHESPLGAIFLACSARGLIRLAFPGQADVQELERLAAQGPGDSQAAAQLELAYRSLADYLEDSSPMDCPVDWQALAPAGAAELAAAQSIPYGERLSYHRLPTALEPRALGRVMGHNPVPIAAPCHRVIRGSEIPVAFVGGPERRRWLADHEAAGPRE